LAYHYLTSGATKEAARELQAVVKLNPKDQLSSQLLASLESPGDSSQPPQPSETTPSGPVSAANLVGNWKSPRPGGSSISLDLNKDAKYTWKYTQQDKTQQFSGTYTVADNLLILNQDGNPAMVGQVALQPDRTFTFKLAGSPASDPGLHFVK
jgi:hypothetical protein